MAYALDSTLSESLETAFSEAVNGKTGRFAGEIVIKGTNLLRGEYGEDSVLIHGSISDADKTINVFEGIDDDHTSGKGFTIPYNRHSTFEQLKEVLYSVMAYHESYAI